MAKLVSSTYGDALFELALEENRLEAMYEEIAAARDVFLQNDELFKLLNHPKVVKDEKIAFIENVFLGRVSDEVMGFFRIIVTKDRYNDMIAIFDYFLHKVKEYKGIGTAHVTSAIALSEEQKAAVEKRLLETTRYHSFDMDYKVDPSILGGLIIRIEDRVVDSSLKTQLDKLTKQLSKIQLS